VKRTLEQLMDFVTAYGKILWLEDLELRGTKYILERKETKLGAIFHALHFHPRYSRKTFSDLFTCYKKEHKIGRKGKMWG